MTDTENLQLIENTRRAFETLLRQATGIEAVVEVCIHSTFQDTRPLAEAARNLDWPVFRNDGLTTYHLPYSSAGGITKVFVPDNSCLQARYARFDLNPLAKKVDLLDQLSALVALARLLSYAGPEEPE